MQRYSLVIRDGEVLTIPDENGSFFLAEDVLNMLKEFDESIEIVYDEDEDNGIS